MDGSPPCRAGSGKRGHVKAQDPRKQRLSQWLPTAPGGEEEGKGGSRRGRSPTNHRHGEREEAWAAVGVLGKWLAS